MSTAPNPLPDPRPAPADPPSLPRRNALAAPAGRDAVGTDFERFTAAVADIHRRLLPDRRGRVAGHLPAPSQAGPDRFAVSVCTVGGQRFSVGDSRTPFAVQSVCKPVNYLMALDELGPEAVHQHVGHEPGGHGFGAPTLTRDGRPPDPIAAAHPDEAGRTLRRAVAAVAEGELRVRVEALPLERVGEAHRRIEAGTTTGKLVLDVAAL
ncbi:glutaminase [Streptomyces sp. PSAA01]|uniref:glutaminase n=1 Tax=Streptomyces sp. PSAA01 TaxID=2912762 RepID=UPI001EFFD0C7|nr:glutaminase [Streptomyces sp. PSAA01]MCG0283623.1 glutaminase [Streptomyces sp. PSAA01]